MLEVGNCQKVGFHGGPCKFSEATIQTDQKLWKNRNYGFVQTVESGKVDGDFRCEITLGALICTTCRTCPPLEPESDPIGAGWELRSYSVLSQLTAVPRPHGRKRRGGTRDARKSATIFTAMTQAVAPASPVAAQ